MASFVRISILSLIAGASLSACNPLSAEKGQLKFSDNSIPVIFKQEPIAPNFVSVYENFIKKSCLDCHNESSKRISFATKQDIIDNASDIVFYAEDGCLLGSCMPPRDINNNPRRPIPTEEVLQAFKEWADNDFNDP